MTEDVREVLCIRYCTTCECDTMALEPEWKCGFCNNRLPDNPANRDGGRREFVD